MNQKQKVKVKLADLRNGAIRARMITIWIVDTLLAALAVVLGYVILEAVL